VLCELCVKVYSIASGVSTQSFTFLNGNNKTKGAIYLFRSEVKLVFE